MTQFTREIRRKAKEMADVAPTGIVPDNEILQPEKMLLVENKSKLFTLVHAINHDKLQCLQWVARRGLVRNQILCDRCGLFYSLGVYNLCTDGYRWRCRGCGRRCSVRNESFFQKSHLSISSIVFLMYWWGNDEPQNRIIAELDISEPTCIDWCNFLRDVCAEDLRLHPVELGGIDEDGTHHVVEIDESYFFHRKYHRGVHRPGKWVFGAVDRSTQQCRVQFVENRRAETLLPLIEEWVLPGSPVISDGWAAYDTIGQLGGGVYLHDVVIHQDNFVDPEHPEINTNTIENLWMKSKRKFKRQFGTSGALFETCLSEFMWRQRHMRERDLFEILLCCVREQYL